MPEVKVELGFFQVQVEGLRGHHVEPGQAAFCVAPERLDAVDVIFAPGELVVAMIDPEMLVVADVDQAVVAAAAVGMDNDSRVDLAPYHRLQRGFRAVGNDSDVDFHLAFQDAEHDRLARSAAPTLAPDAVWAEVGLVDFDRP